MHPYREPATCPLEEIDDESERIARLGRIRRWLRWRGTLPAVVALGAPFSLWVWIGVRAVPERPVAVRAPVERSCKSYVVCGSCQRIGEFRAATLLRCVNPPDPAPSKDWPWCSLLDVPECR